ncbi:MAG: hypothetical protein EZS28_024736 [Streblomastix strix]|uniref:Uncharacterized protein n=1 Tax=Streblomastix strix TaxID=222440 RepID=A0A5J4VBC4_9EUKA|nr:MAG: hypothetical protein EZS28_024736 [Streblomastix strix]
MKGQTWYLNKEMRQGEKGVTNYYPRLPWRQVNVRITTRGEIEKMERIFQRTEGLNKPNDAKCGLEHAFGDSYIARECGAVEQASELIVQTQNAQVKLLCWVVISIIGQLGTVISGELDWTCVCAPLVAMLFQADDAISNIGKKALTTLLEQYEFTAKVLLQVSFIDRAIEALHKSLPNEQQSSSIQLSQIVVMNILTILELILTTSIEKIPISIELLEILDTIIKQVKTNSIRLKAKMILSGFESVWKINNAVQIEENGKDELMQLKLKLRESERKRIEAEVKQQTAGQEMQDLLRIINAQQNIPDIKQTDWIMMQNELEKEEVGTDEQKEEIWIKKINVCQKIIANFIGKVNDEGKKLAIQAGIIDSLHKLLTMQPLERITISHIWAFYIFTYPSSDEVKSLLINKNPYSVLIRLLDHSDILIINRTLASIFNILLTQSETAVSEVHPHFATLQENGGIQKLFALFQNNEYKLIKDVVAQCIVCIF